MKKIVLTLLTAIMTGALILSACGSVPKGKGAEKETPTEKITEAEKETPPVSSSPAEEPESAAYDDDPYDGAGYVADGRRNGRRLGTLEIAGYDGVLGSEHLHAGHPGHHSDAVLCVY